MADRKLDFNPLEARGLFMLQANVLQASQAVEQAAMNLRAAEADAAKAIAGRVPDGVTIRGLRIDQRTSEVYCAEETPKPAA